MQIITENTICNQMCFFRGGGLQIITTLSHFIKVRTLPFDYYGTFINLKKYGNNTDNAAVNSNIYKKVIYIFLRKISFSSQA